MKVAAGALRALAPFVLLALAGSGCALRTSVRDAAALEELAAGVAAVATVAPDDRPAGLEAPERGDLPAAERTAPAPAPTPDRRVAVATSPASKAPARLVAEAGPAKVTVRFEPPLATSKLEVTTAGGAHCTMPCELQLPPGPVEVTIGGELEHWQEVLVPAGGGTLRLGFVRTGAAKVGTGLLVIGAVIGAVGMVMLPLGLTVGIVPAGVGLLALLGGWALSDNVRPQLEWIPPPSTPPSVAPAPLARRDRRSQRTAA